MYKAWGKRAADILLSLCAMIGLSWLFALIALAIYVDDPGPVMFTQRRVGVKKNGKLTYFKLHKFRSMKMSTPHDVPTHLLENPDSYITRVGKFLRKSSLDELPQIWDIFVGKMSIIGPRPALWNQDDLVAEREKYGANDAPPGLTGWAQVNGRDEVTIEEKARLDGEYVANISVKMDVTCFWATVGNVLKAKGVVEGGTGMMEKSIRNRQDEVGTNG